MQSKFYTILKKTGIAFISLLLMASCAIHKDFPFICFRYDCIANQFGLPDINIKAAKKKRRAKAGARQKKRERARNKKLREKGNSLSGKPDYYVSNPKTEGTVTEKPDSTKYSFKSVTEDRYIIIRFVKTNPDGQDSLLVKYPDNSNEYSSYEKQIIRNYLDSYEAERISTIIILEHFGTKEENEYKNKHTSPVKRNLKNYLIQLGIPPEKIR